jgi:hypothetical protein
VTRTRLVLLVLLVVIGLVIGLLALLVLWTPTAPVPEQPPPPAAAPRKTALQADAEGQYVPGYRFAVGRLRFTGFSLRPEALVTFAHPTSGTEEVAGCLEATITATSIRLRCESPEVGIVTIQGRFLTRVATNRLDTPVVSAVVTVRAPSGEAYSARDAFVWQPSR